MAAAELMRTLVISKIRRSAIVNQRSGEGGDNFDVRHRFASALRMQYLDGPPAIGDDLGPLRLAGDVEAGFIGVECRLPQYLSDGGVFPRFEGGMQSLDEA